MKVLLFGKSGQLGWELQRALAPLGELVALGSSDEAFASDFREPSQLAETVERIRPDVIVNAAAYTAVDRAEIDAATAHRVNAEAPGVLARAARKCGALLVHYSTDYVFDGEGQSPWRESDTTGPLNVYGRTKCDGEEQVISGCERHLLLRTSWVYAARGTNFPKTMLRLAGERDHLQVIDDQFGAPTGADLLADLSAHAIRQVIAQPDLAGVYHVAAAGEVTWHGYACHVIENARKAGRSLRIDDAGIQPVSSAAFPTPARRPRNSRLDCRKFEAAFGLHMPHWRSGVDRLLQTLFH